ncbi:MAG: hypothetical protein JNG88_13570 [Phycisphaerales bacterium]|nr:hypothetical protein [Phycisphaerales bacterium]
MTPTVTSTYTRDGRPDQVADATGTRGKLGGASAGAEGNFTTARHGLLRVFAPTGVAAGATSPLKKPVRAAELLQIDYALTIGEQRIPVEIKYRKRIDHRDVIGLQNFINQPHYNAPFGVLVTLLDEQGTDAPRIVSLPLSTLLMLR